MLRSMYTAITALNLNQSYMDVIADNLANANTPGFKTSRVTFKDQVAQTMSIGSGPTAELGGTNPVQIGMGARLGDVTTNFLQGTLQGTGRLTDLAIQGDGFFIYRDGNESFYSRNGSLDLDAQGYLVNSSSGQRVQGWMAAGGVVDPGMAISDIQAPLDSTLARETSNVYMGGNLDSDVAASGFDVTVGVYDSLGALHSVSVNLARQAGTNIWDWTATSGAAGSGTVSFDVNGQFTGGGGSVTVPPSGGAAATVVNLDMSKFTQLATSHTVSSFNQDGLAAGSLTAFNVISTTGEIFASYSNGLQEIVGQLSMAKFANPSGLKREGQSLWRAGLNSGTPEVGVANTGGRGTLLSGYLEASNVDLSQEFTNMIIAQRGFQAASRVITASDQILQELVNLGR